MGFDADGLKIGAGKNGARDCRFGPEMGVWAKSPPVCMCACVHVQHLAGELNSTGAVVSDEQGRMLSEVRVCWCHERGGAKTLSVHRPHCTWGRHEGAR